MLFLSNIFHTDKQENKEMVVESQLTFPLRCSECEHMVTGFILTKYHEYLQ